MQKRTFLKSFALLGVLAVSAATAAPIPASSIRLGANGSRNGNVYIVKVAKKAGIANQTIGLQFTPDRKAIAGKRIRFSAELKYSGIASDVTGGHVGAKLMLTFKEKGSRKFLSTPSLTGSCNEWKTYSLDMHMPGDPDAFSDFTLYVGIQQAWGSLQIRNLRMDVVVETPKRFSIPEGTTGAVNVPLKMLSGAKIVGDTVVVEVAPRKAITNETRGATLALDMEKMKNKYLCVRAEVRYTDVGSDTTGAHVGVKLLNDIVTPYAGRKFAFSPSLTGSSNGWKKLAVYCPLTDFTSESRVIFGLQQAWGKAEFRNITAEVLCPTDAGPQCYSVPEDFKCEYTDAVKNLPPHRGFMTVAPFRLTEQDIRDLAAMGANLIRYQMVDGIRSWTEEIADLELYDAWMEKQLAKLDSLMPVLKETGVRVVVDMHWSPGHRYGRTGRLPASVTNPVTKLNPGRLHRLMIDEVYFNYYIDLWKKIAARYKDNPVVFGYDLINEPDISGPTTWHWLDVQYLAAKAIREVDPEMPVIVESNYLADPATFNVKPMPLKNIIYEIHMYNPMTYSHQGVGNKSYAEHYPDHCTVYKSNSEELRASMKPVIDFQKKYGARIYVGEFSVVRWAPEAGKYLDDLLPVFEDYGWDWTFHAFREWDGWSPEHVGAPNSPKVDPENDRLQTLKKFFERNKR